MSDEEVQAKFRRLAGPLTSENKIKNMISCIGNIEQIKDMGERMDLLTVWAYFAQQ